MADDQSKNKLALRVTPALYARIEAARERLGGRLNLSEVAEAAIANYLTDLERKGTKMLTAEARARLEAERLTDDAGDRETGRNDALGWINSTKKGRATRRQLATIAKALRASEIYDDTIGHSIVFQGLAAALGVEIHTTTISAGDVDAMALALNEEGGDPTDRQHTVEGWLAFAEACADAFGELGRDQATDAEVDAAEDFISDLHIHGWHADQVRDPGTGDLADGSRHGLTREAVATLVEFYDASVLAKVGAVHRVDWGKTPPEPPNPMDVQRARAEFARRYRSLRQPR